jgi:hypothetical protein
VKSERIGIVCDDRSEKDFCLAEIPVMKEGLCPLHGALPIRQEKRKQENKEQDG